MSVLHNDCGIFIVWLLEGELCAWILPVVCLCSLWSACIDNVLKKLLLGLFLQLFTHSLWVIDILCGNFFPINSWVQPISTHTFLPSLGVRLLDTKIKPKQNQKWLRNQKWFKFFWGLWCQTTPNHKCLHSVRVSLLKSKTFYHTIGCPWLMRLNGPIPCSLIILKGWSAVHVNRLCSFNLFVKYEMAAYVRNHITEKRIKGSTGCLITPSLVDWLIQSKSLFSLRSPVDLVVFWDFEIDIDCLFEYFLYFL